MIAYIKNKETYAREIQYYGKNHFIVVDALSQVEIKDINSPSEVAYYNSLTGSGFSVCFHDEDTNECVCSEVKIKHPDGEVCNSEVSKPTAESRNVTNVSENDSLDLSDLTLDQLKSVISNLGITTKLRSRLKLEELIKNNLPEGKTVEDYM